MPGAWNVYLNVEPAVRDRESKSGALGTDEVVLREVTVWGAESRFRLQTTMSPEFTVLTIF